MSNDIHIHVHIHNDSEHRIIERIDKLEARMAVDFAAFKQLLNDIDAESTRIAGVLADILLQLKNGGLTPAQEQELFDQANAELTKLQGIGKEDVPTNGGTQV